MKNKTLLIIDAQNDFINGSLTVDNAESKMINLSSYIAKHYNEYKNIILTCDWHPHNHISFNEWPKHCIQHTYGAAIYRPLFDSVLNSTVPFIVLTKGNIQNEEEYSILKNFNSKIRLVDAINSNRIDEIDVCGIANEFCVLNTVKDLFECNDIKANINVLIDFVAAIKDDNVLINECKKLNIKIK